MIEPEPVYVYMRGHGWVANACESLEMQTSKGKRYLLLARTPNLGELCIWSSSTNKHYTTDGKPNLEAWVNYLMSSIESTHIYKENTREEAIKNYYGGAPDVIFITVVPL